MLKKIEHIGLEVADLDRSVRFYTEVLGLAVADTAAMGDLSIAFMQIGDSQLELLCWKKQHDGYGKEGAFPHLAFTVDDIDSRVAHLRAKGVNCTSEAPMEALNGCKIFFFRGPDNEILELFQPRPLS